MAVKRENVVLRFGAFELDSRSRELRKHGVRIKLHEKPFQLLEALIERPGELITRKELQERLWPGDTFVEFESGLNNAVSRLREALADSADSPRYIETVPRRGYRFVAPVETPPLEPVHEPVTVLPVAPPPAPRRRSSWIGAFAFGLLALILSAVAYRSFSSHDAVIRSIAVLPLSYRGTAVDTDGEFLADGMTGALITELSKINELKVISETSVKRFKNTNKRLPEIAEELGADAVIEGAVEREGDRVRVIVQMIHAASDSHIWSEKYERALGSLLTLQNEIAIAIAREVRATLTPNVESRVAAADIHPDAFVHYMKGRQLLSRKTETELYLALDHFQQVIRLEPNYAPAFAGIARTWQELAGWNAYIMPREGFPKAKAAAKRALELDRASAEAHTSLAFTLEVYDWDLPAAESQYQQAIAQNKNYAPAHQLYAQHLNRTGRPEEALKEARRAFELDPLAPEVNLALAMMFLGNGLLEEAQAQFDKLIELDPAYFEAYVHLADLLMRLKKPEEALAAAKRGVELSQNSPHPLDFLARISFRSGKRNEAQALFRELERSPKAASYHLATLSFVLGYPDKGFKWLRQACDERSPDMAFLQIVIARDSLPFKPFAEDARLKDILRCAALPP